MAYDDDDDWTGTPPEGHISRERADPAFWAANWRPLAVAGVVLTVLLAAVVVLALI